MSSESDITVQSPAVISLFGEHAMTYGKFALSNSNIEQIIEVAKSCGALGAKMEDGGGLVVALGKDAPTLAEAIWKAGYPASVTSVSFSGGSSYLK